MIKKIICHILCIITLGFYGLAWADSFPFPNIVYAVNCNAGSTSILFDTVIGGGQMLSITLEGDQASKTLYSEMEVKEGGGGQKMILVRDASTNLFGRYFVDQNKFEIYSFYMNGKKVIEDGVFASTGAKSPIYYACGPTSVAKLNFDRKLTNILGVKVCVGCPTTRQVTTDKARVVNGCRDYADAPNETGVVGVDPRTGKEVVGYTDRETGQFIPYCPMDINKLARGMQQMKGSNSAASKQCKIYQAAKQACATAADVRGCIHTKSGGIDPSAGDSPACNFY